MPQINCTNIQETRAMKGAAVTVTLSPEEVESVFPVLQEGQIGIVQSGANFLTIYSIDRLGNTFKILPRTLADTAESDTPGFLKNDELLTIDF